MSKVSFDLSGKVALVTGATHGIGMAVAKGLAQQGAQICVNDIDEAKLEACGEEYKKDGIEVYRLVFDVTSEEDVDRGISQIEKEVGPIDILVNNAGIIRRVPILKWISMSSNRSSRLIWFLRSSSPSVLSRP